MIAVLGGALLIPTGFWWIAIPVILFALLAYARAGGRYRVAVGDWVEPEQSDAPLPTVQLMSEEEALKRKQTFGIISTVMIFLGVLFGLLLIPTGFWWIGALMLAVGITMRVIARNQYLRVTGARQLNVMEAKKHAKQQRSSEAAE